MTYSLWRNGELIGRILPEYPSDSPHLIVGMLQPTSAFPDVGPLMQHHDDILPGRPVFEDRIKPEKRAPSEKKIRVMVPLKPMSAEQMRGIAPELVIEVRDDKNQPVRIDGVFILEGPNAADDVLELCGHCGVDYTPWTAMVSLRTAEKDAALEEYHRLQGSP